MRLVRLMINTTTIVFCLLFTDWYNQLHTQHIIIIININQYTELAGSIRMKQDTRWNLNITDNYSRPSSRIQLNCANGQGLRCSRGTCFQAMNIFKTNYISYKQPEIISLFIIDHLSTFPSLSSRVLTFTFTHHHLLMLGNKTTKTLSYFPFFHLL